MSEQETTFEIPQNIDRYLATLSKYYGKENQNSGNRNEHQGVLKHGSHKASGQGSNHT